MVRRARRSAAEVAYRIEPLFDAELAKQPPEKAPTGVACAMSGGVGK